MGPMELLGLLVDPMGGHPTILATGPTIMCIPSRFQKLPGPTTRARSCHATYRHAQSGPSRRTLLAGLLLTAALLPPPGATAQQPRFTVEVEAGPVWQSRNDAEIPNDGTATRFSIQELVGSGPWPAARVTLGWNPWEKHGFRVLLAPLNILESGTPADDIRFQGEVFQGGISTQATYTFNSWRATYRYLAFDGERARGWVGFTAKVRDAVVALDQDLVGGGRIQAEKTDLGFVPLLHLAGEWAPSPAWRLALEADALAGGPGRAIDAAFTLGRTLGEGVSVNAGYRTVEGGADIEEVYSFAWLHYAVVSLRWET